MIRALYITLFFLSSFSPIQSFYAQFSPKSYYLIDSLDLTSLNNKDSLLIETTLVNYHKTDQDTVKIILLNKIVEECWDENIWPKYNDFILIEITNYLKQPNLDKKSIRFYLNNTATALSNKGYSYTEKGEFETALSYFKMSLPISLNNEDVELLMSTYNNIGYVYMNQSNNLKAIDYYHQSLKIAEKINNEENIAIVSSNLGHLYYADNKLKKALDYHNKSLQIRLKSNNQHGISNCYNNIAAVYSESNKLDSAIYIHKKSLEISREINDDFSIATSLNNIGSIYRDLGQLNKAKTYLQESIRIRKTINDKRGLAISYYNLGVLYFNKKQNNEAEKLAKLSLKFAKEINVPSSIRNAFKLLYQINEQTNNYKISFIYFKKYIAIRDSVKSDLNRDALVTQELKYAYEKETAIQKLSHDKKILVKEEEINRKNYFLTTAILGVVLMVLFFAVLYNRYRLINKQQEIIDTQNIITIKQKEELYQKELLDLKQKAKLNSLKSYIDGEEEERKRVAKDLHDSLGGLLSITNISLNELGTQYQVISEDTKYKKTNHLLEKSIQEVRRISQKLIPSSIVKFGLIYAVKELITEVIISEKTTIDFQLIGAEKTLTESAQLNIYRIIQEAMNNIVKHANTNSIFIQFTFHSNRLNIVIEDDGIGFNTGSVKKGMGLENINERILILNGSIDIDSSVNAGTTIMIDIPI